MNGIRTRRRRVLASVALAVLTLGLCTPRPVSDLGTGAVPVARAAEPLTCLNTALNAYGDAGLGWTGGDSTWSAPLPGGREVFVFSDTFLPPVSPPVRPPDAGFVHNSFLIREADGRISTVLGGDPAHPASLVAPGDPSRWFWAGAAVHLDGALQVPLTEWRATGTGSLDIAFAGSSVARFDERDPRTPTSITPLPRARGIQWGQWVLPEGARTYIYGVETAADRKYLHVARIAGGDLRLPFSFRTSDGWSDAEDASARVTDDIGAEFSVHRLRDGRYLLLGMAGGGGFSDRLVGRYGPTPTGPFGPAATLYVTPETGASGSYHDPDVYTYNAHVHPEFSTPARLVVSYNVNSIDTAAGGDVYRDIGIYRPRFVTLTLADDATASAATEAPRPACP